MAEEPSSWSGIGSQDHGAVDAPDGIGPGPRRPTDEPDTGVGRPVCPMAGRRRAGRSRHRARWLLLAAGLLLVVVVVVGWLWVDGQVHPSGPRGAQVVVTVAPGASTEHTLDVLSAKGVMGSPLAFRLWTIVHGSVAIDAGTYAFNRNDGFAAVWEIFNGGPNVFHLDVRPGLTVAEVAGQLGLMPGQDGVAFERLATSGVLRSPYEPAGSKSLEGLLGTGVYEILPGETDRTLLGQMIARFDAEAASAGLAAGAAALGYTPYQVVTVASIDEKEGVYGPNLGPVARVIYNRLARGMPLQMDSTVLYALGQDGGTVTHADEATPSPYNTYLNTGLTPTPICFPSTAALAAALHPPAGQWLYFQVVSENGTEAFADTFAQQLANEKLAQERGLP